LTSLIPSKKEEKDESLENTDLNSGWDILKVLLLIIIKINILKYRIKL